MCSLTLYSNYLEYTKVGSDFQFIQHKHKPAGNYNYTGKKTSSV